MKRLVDPAKKAPRMCAVIQGEKRHPKKPNLTVPLLVKVRKTYGATVPELNRPVEDEMNRFLYANYMARHVGPKKMASYCKSLAELNEMYARKNGFLAVYKEVKAGCEQDGLDEEKK